MRVKRSVRPSRWIVGAGAGPALMVMLPLRLTSCSTQRPSPISPVTVERCPGRADNVPVARTGTSLMMVPNPVVALSA
jgi:hypothetical protein